MPISRSFYFIRHGQTDWNAEGRLQGHTDVPLNDVGRSQARAAISYFKNLNIDLIVSSPLARAHETAKIIAHDLNVTVEKYEGLIERNFGSNEGRFIREIKAEYAENPEKEILKEVSDFPHAVDAEFNYDFENRLIKSVDDVLQKTNHNVLVMGHGAVFAALNRVIMALDKREYARCQNATPYHFEKRNDGTWDIQKVTL